VNRIQRLTAAALAAVLLVLGGVGQSASADDLSHRRQQVEAARDANEKAAEALEAALEELSGDLAVTVAELQKIEQQIPAAQATLDAANAVLDEALRKQQVIAAQLADAKAQEQVLGTQIADGDAKEEEIRLAIGQLARQAYRSQGDVTGLEVILDAEDAEDFVDRYTMLNAAQRTQEEVFGELADLEAANRNSAARLESVRVKIAELKAEADEQVAIAEEARQTAEAAKAELDRLRTQIASKKASIEGQRAQYLADLAEVDKAKAELDAELAAIVEEQRRLAAEQKSTARPGQALPGAWFANPTATVPMYVTSEYGMRLHPVLGYYRLHAGIDLRDYCGQPVYAGRDGEVQWTRYRSGYGNQIMVDHGWVDGKSLMSSYNHLTRFNTSAGAWVTAGQLIGYAGNTGTSSACHLHFEVYINGATVNPRPYLGL
jgi:murein DD-endopeptidase MepM/ murein hydrolase activator NlpD